MRPVPVLLLVLVIGSVYSMTLLVTPDSPFTLESFRPSVEFEFCQLLRD